MADLLNRLTIDNVPMDIWNDRFPKAVQHVDLGNFSVANNTDVNKTFLTTQEKGIIIGAITVEFANNSTGYRQTNALVDGAALTGFLVQAVSSGAATRVVIPFVRGVDSGVTIGVRLRHNAGATLSNCRAYIHCAFIPDVVGG